MFTGVSHQICATAWDIVQPAIRQAAEQGVIDRFAGAVVVLDPYATSVSGYQDGQSVAEAADQPGVLFMAEIDGSTEIDPATFRRVALAKAHVSLTVGHPSRIVQQQMPHLYQAGMTKWGGSTVRDGLVVAFSGVQAVFDEMISGWMADAVIALCRNEMTRPGGVLEQRSIYVDG